MIKWVALVMLWSVTGGFSQEPQFCGVEKEGFCQRFVVMDKIKTTTSPTLFTRPARETDGTADSFKTECGHFFGLPETVPGKEACNLDGDTACCKMLRCGSDNRGFCMHFSLLRLSRALVNYPDESGKCSKAMALKCRILASLNVEQV